MIDSHFYRKTESIIQSYKDELSQDALKDHIKKQFSNEPSHIQKRILEEFYGYGPIEELINNKDITEIIINGAKNIFFEINGQMQEHNDQFYSNSTFNNFVHLINQKTGTKIDIAKPHLNTKWNNYRVHMINSPLTSQPCITLRKNSGHQWNFAKLIENEWAQSYDVDALINYFKLKKNILVIGSTGSGKTTVLNSMLQTVHENERCIIIEDTDELIAPNNISTKLVTRESQSDLLLNYNQTELLKQSLRMRPNRIIVGEIRGGEAKDYLMALSTGHEGGLCSMHAACAKQALIRLEMLIQIGAPQWSLNSIRRLIQLSLDTIITVSIKDGRRYLKSIDLLGSLENNGIIIENVVRK